MTDDLSAWHGILTPEQIAEIERVAGLPPAQAIRLNTLKIDRETALQTWPGWYGWRLEPVPFCPDGLFFKTRPDGLGRTLEHRMGFFYIQDMASMLPTEMFTSLSTRYSYDSTNVFGNPPLTSPGPSGHPLHPVEGETERSETKWGRDRNSTDFQQFTSAPGAWNLEPGTWNSSPTRPGDPVGGYGITHHLSLPLVLDMAAAPGGKTTHLACKTGDRGLIVANDISGGRAGAMLSNLRRWGMTSAAVTNLPGERLGRWLPETFDAVLLDAPCSGENLRSEGGSKQRQVSARERRSLHDRQVRLLLSAFGAAKPGGEVVYATCTVAPEEDEAALDDFLTHVGRAAEIVRPEGMAGMPGGLATYHDQAFDPQVGGAVRLWPYLFDTGSFFAALIRKHDSLPSKEDRMPGSGPRRGNFSLLPPEDRARVAAALREDYGFNLDALLEERQLDAWSTGRFVHAIPRALETYFEGLPVKAAGMLIGDMGEDGFVPSHELVSRFFDRFAVGRLRLPDDLSVVWFSGGEIKDAVAPPSLEGRVALLEDTRGRFLGRGRVSGGRIRNLLPAGF